MIRLITAGAMALLLAACGGDAKDEGGNTPNANASKVVTDASAEYLLGEEI